SEPIRAWGNSAVAGFRERTLSGLPAGWRIFSGNSATDDAMIRGVASRLSFQREARRIHVRGGIHIPGKQSYFRFAPPSIRLDGFTDDALLINGAAAVREEDGSFAVPPDLLSESLITVTCGTLKQRIYLEDGSSAPEWQLRSYGKDGGIGPGIPE